MKFEHGLGPGMVLDRQTLMDTFKVAPQGGMRRSHRTNALVLINDTSQGLYHDRWKDGVFHYTGMGQVGDQSLDYMQNKTLAQSESLGIDVYLFEVQQPNEYKFMGEVRLCDSPYQERQPDKNGDERNVWVFPLALVDNAELSGPDSVQQDGNAETSDTQPFQLGYASEQLGLFGAGNRKAGYEQGGLDEVFSRDDTGSESKQSQRYRTETLRQLTKDGQHLKQHLAAREASLRQWIGSIDGLREDAMEEASRTVVSSEQAASLVETIEQALTEAKTANEVWTEQENLRIEELRGLRERLRQATEDLTQMNEAIAAKDRLLASHSAELKHVNERLLEREEEIEDLRRQVQNDEQKGTLKKTVEQILQKLRK